MTDDFEDFEAAAKMLEDASVVPVGGKYWFTVGADGAWHPLGLEEAEAMAADLRRDEAN